MFWEDLSGPVFRLQAIREEIGVLDPSGGYISRQRKKVYPFSIFYAGLALYISWKSFANLKEQGPKFVYSPLSSAEVQYEWSCTSSPPICLHSFEGDKFTFFFAN